MVWIWDTYPVNLQILWMSSELCLLSSLFPKVPRGVDTLYAIMRGKSLSFSVNIFVYLSKIISLWAACSITPIHCWQMLILKQWWFMGGGNYSAEDHIDFCVLLLCYRIAYMLSPNSLPCFHPFSTQILFSFPVLLTPVSSLKHDWTDCLDFLVSQKLDKKKSFGLRASYDYLPVL